ncbi:MAG: hypothetical protein KDC13_00840 [Bacteroidetes bacterium]|nr:hypothetical protein [Bacteroidota bacterium]
MVHLSDNWLTEHRIDAEYKQYILLAYLEGVRKQFNSHLLYPELSELVEHYARLSRTRKEFEEMSGKFPSKIKSLDLKEMQISYEKVVRNDSLMAEIEQIIAFSVPKMKAALEEGKFIYSELEKLLVFEPVGLMPLNSTEGYMLMETREAGETHIFEYNLSIYANASDSFRSLSTRFITTITRGTFETPESIKINLIKKRKELPNPATYWFRTSEKIPFQEAYLPIAKRMLIREIG